MTERLAGPGHGDRIAVAPVRGPSFCSLSLDVTCRTRSAGPEHAEQPFPGTGPHHGCAVGTDEDLPGVLRSETCPAQQGLQLARGHQVGMGVVRILMVRMRSRRNSPCTLSTLGTWWPDLSPDSGDG
ncbi:hypothetical protein ABIB29_003511 [Arthrobacter sp. UYEF36]